jgi:hypothetical protein
VLHLFPVFILLKYPLTFLKPGESMPVFQEESHIDAMKVSKLETLLNAEATGVEGVHVNLN